MIETVDKTTTINQKLFNDVTHILFNQLINHRHQNDVFTNHLSLIKRVFHQSYWNDVRPVACHGDNNNNNNDNNNSNNNNNDNINNNNNNNNNNDNNSNNNSNNNFVI